MNLDDEKATIQISSTSTASIDKSKVRLMLSPDDLILARMPSDSQNRFFLAIVAAKKTKEVYETLNMIKVKWVATSGAHVVGFIPHHLRDFPIVDRIIPLRHPSALDQAVSTSTYNIGADLQLTGYHF